MKRAFLCLLLVLFFQNFTFSQTVDLSRCAEFSVTGPFGATKPDGLMEFTADFKAFDISKLKFEWMVTNGKIIKGQNSLSIEVKEIEENVPTTATIKISGLPDFCPNTGFAEGLIAVCFRSPRVIAEYGKITNREEKEKLGNLMSELQKEPTSSGLILKAFSPRVNKKNIYNQLFQILKFSESYEIDPNRIKFLIMSDTEASGKLFVIAAGSNFPAFDGEYLDAAQLSEKSKSSKLKTGRILSK